ncbi:hypothetical protein [Polaribacter sp.]|uniref:hypothetical protein n=1 Tax=Polaribacter sp. TaxID=1920175 RepID=UPI0035C868CF
MNKAEERLFKLIRENLPKNVSLIEDVASVLDVNYDAAYRRIKGKTALTLNEALVLSKHYNLDLKNLSSENSSENRVISVEKTHGEISIDFLYNYFNTCNIEIQAVLNSKKGKIISCANDLPCYHINNSILKKFRIYLLVSMLPKKENVKTISFANFNPSDTILDVYDSFVDNYKKVALIEIWNDFTIDNLINQITYFFEIGLLKEDEAIAILEGLVNTLQQLEQQAKNEKRAVNDNTFKLYCNNLISLSDTIFMQTDTLKKAFVPYTNLTYFKVTDIETSAQVEKHLNKQLQYSTNISGESSVARKMFFNKMYQKIEKSKQKLML